MSFVLRMAWRDSRASRRRLLAYSLSVVLGIAALVSIGSFTANLRRAIEVESKGLLGADLAVSAPAPLAPPVAAALTAVAGEGGALARERLFSSMMTFPTARGALRLVQVRALEGDFPFYGEFVTEPAGGAAALRRGGAVVVLEATLMDQFKVRVGDAVRLGRTSFTVVGALRKIPGEAAAVGLLAPRAFIPLAELPGTGLTGVGALASDRVMLRLPAGRAAEAVVRGLRERFHGTRLSFDTVAERQRELGRALTNIDGFLSLVGFVALFLGGIGVASALQAYAQQKVATVAVLRCLGASGRQSLAVYLVQGGALGLAGAAAGAALGVAVQTLLPALLKDVLPFPVDFFIAWPAVARGMGAGVAICLLFALLPLLAVRRVPPLAALRASAAEPGVAGPDPWRVAVWLAIAAAVTAFAIAQTGSLRIGLGFAGMLGAGFASLALLAVGVAWAARRFVPRRWPYVVRQGFANLHRPNNRTVLLLVALGLGTFLVLTLFLARTTLLREVAGTGAGGRPDLLFFDIQDDQIGPLTRLLQTEGAPVQQSAPIVTMKLLSLRGETVEALLQAREGREPESREPGSREGEARGRTPRAAGRRGGAAAARSSGLIPAWTLRREYRSTFRGALSGTEQVVRGVFTGRADPAAGPVPISLEESLADDLQVKLGDEIVWDVQGLSVTTRVTSVRAVEWRRLEPNFYVVFPDGVLGDAPTTWVVAVSAGAAAVSAKVQQAVVGAFPNVTAIDLALLVETIDGIFSKVAFVIEFMALFTVATGVVVLTSAVLTGRFQRVRETVLLRTLGASRRQIGRIQLVEYSLLGFLAGGVGIGLAVIANALLARTVFQTAPAAPPAQLAVAWIAMMVLTVATGFWSNRGIADHPPLEVLRGES
jgi:putative ABC transport system permease protein